jgi:D-alanyl-D-alanine carboxypeptidase/D-alanyl-D-alanine-endopeptidase (penicillin-binding protein 4)
MRKQVLFLCLVCFSVSSAAQERSLTQFLGDGSMKHASVSLCIIESETGKSLLEKNSGLSLTPGSVMKLFTTSAALELLGPDHCFRTIIGFTGSLDKSTGRLDGNIVIKGGGDPALGSENFSSFYEGFIDQWITEISKMGIREINGCIISDDSYYDYQPVPSKWPWEDIGNYYGAGVYGLSVYDNIYEIHLQTLPDTNNPVITAIIPDDCGIELDNRLTATGTEDKGYVFAAPYSKSGWIEGTIPLKSGTFILKASIPDPPLLLAKILDRRLKESGVKISGEPSTIRLLELYKEEDFIPLSELISPPLKEIIRVLNHKSVNLYAEHLVKELGLVFSNSGTTSKGIEVIYKYLSEKGIETEALFMVDGSGLSPLDAVSSWQVAELLRYMKKEGKYFTWLHSSLPDAGKEGTLKQIFRDPIFESSLRAKSGSMTVVRAYAGFLKAKSGKELIFCIIINNFSGSSKEIISNIERILKEAIINN